MIPKTAKQLLSSIFLGAATLTTAYSAPIYYVANQTGNTVQMYNSGGVLISGITASPAYSTPYAVELDQIGNIWVSDYGNSRIDKFNSSGTQLFSATSALLSNPRDLASDGLGNMYATNANGNIDKITSTGTVSQIGTIAGSRGIAYFGGFLYIDSSTTGTITKMDTSGGTLSTFVSTSIGSGNLRGMAFDAAGDLFVSDTTYNTTTGQIYKITAGGNTPVAFGSATFQGPNDLAIDAAGNVFVAQYDGSAIGELSSTGTSLGNVVTGLSGPSGIALGSSAVPEPATFGFAVAGLAALTCLRRRQA